MRKPKDVKMREFVSRVQELNGYLANFPPFEENQLLPQDEIMDILEFAIPNAWKNQATLQGIDILSNTPQELVEFCERLELVEDIEESKNERKSSKKSSSSKHEKEDSRKRKSETSTKVCLLHGPGHSTDECRTLQAQAKRMKSTYQSQTPDGKKSWKKREETHALVAKIVKKMQKASKRKSSSESSNEKDEEFHLTEQDFASIDISSDSHSSESE